MAKLLLVLFLAGCILNISYSRLIPQRSDLVEPLDADYGTKSEVVSELNPEDDSNSLTEVFKESKKVGKRQAGNENATPSNKAEADATEASTGSEGQETTEASEGQVTTLGPTEPSTPEATVGSTESSTPEKTVATVESTEPSTPEKTVATVESTEPSTPENPVATVAPTEPPTPEKTVATVGPTTKPSTPKKTKVTVGSTTKPSKPKKPKVTVGSTTKPSTPKKPKVTVGSATKPSAPTEGPLPSSTTMAPGSDFQLSVETIINTIDNVAEIVKQFGEFNELIFGIFETIQAIGGTSRAALDVEEDSSEEEFAFYFY
ncbi:unnamed protein product [Ceutorhynchus assimilis]|uniref:Uncharacterized protein n=1 Tax=Ceutorhynchus assimilis TaxID=467358 RepID=A0A9N9MS93_9CUCU|nr:unnamed protein product [Ceutorhynchus assimilis]